MVGRGRGGAGSRVESEVQVPQRDLPGGSRGRGQSAGVVGTARGVAAAGLGAAEAGEMRCRADATGCRAMCGGFCTHSARCMAYLDGKNEDLDRCVDLFERRVTEASDTMEKADKTPRSPARKERRHGGEAPDSAH